MMERVAVTVVTVSHVQSFARGSSPTTITTSTPTASIFYKLDVLSAAQQTVNIQTYLG